MLKIKCPSCSSQFKVGEEFLGKYVECGSCEYQFTVAETHITNQQRKTHYPVHKENDLSTFSKTFDNVDTSVKSTYQESHLNSLSQDDFMPRPLWKKAITLLGWGLMVGGALLLALGAIKDGFLTDAGYDKRFIIAGFIAFVSSICFFLGAKHLKGGVPKCLLAMLLLGGLAYFLPMYESPTRGNSPVVSQKKPETKDIKTPIENEYLSITKLKEICRYTPVQEAINKAQSRGDTEAKSVIAIWIKSAALDQQYAIQDYFKNTLNLKNRPSYYPRKTGALLILQNLQDYTIQDVAEMSDIFGPMDDIYVSQRLISITYDKNLFLSVQASRESVISDPSSTDFYRLNLSEAKHFDSNRVLSALKRLENVEPRFTSDALSVFKFIIKRYKEPKIINSASSCILNWFGNDLNKHVSYFDKAATYEKRGNDPEQWPSNLLTLLLKAGSNEAPSTALELWKNDPTEWEKVLINSGRDFTSLVSNQVSSDRIKNLSIINIIEKTRSPQSKSLLKSLRGKLDSSYHSSIDNAMRGL